MQKSINCPSDNHKTYERLLVSLEEKCTVTIDMNRDNCILQDN